MNHKFLKSDHKAKSFKRFSLSKALFKRQNNLKISIKTSTNEGKTFFLSAVSGGLSIGAAELQRPQISVHQFKYYQ